MIEHLPSQSARTSPNRSTLLWRVVFTGVNLLQLFVIGILIDQLIFTELELNRWVWLALLSLLMFAVIKGQGWLVLLGLQISLGVRIYGNYQFGFSQLNFLYCCLALLTIAYACCFDQWGQVFSRNLADAASRRIKLPNLKRTTNIARNNKRVVQKDLTLLEFLSGFVHLAVVISAVFVALAVLDFFPVSRSGRNTWVQAALASTGSVWPGPKAIMILFTALLIFRHLGWRRLTRSQAGIYLRTEFVNYYFRDIQNMITWINKKVRSDEKRRETAFRRRGPGQTTD